MEDRYMQLIDDEFVVLAVLNCFIGYKPEVGKIAFSLYPSVMRITDRRVVLETRLQQSEVERKAQEVILKAVASLTGMPRFVNRRLISDLMFNPNRDPFDIPLETIDIKNTISNHEGLLSIVVNDTCLPVRMDTYSAIDAQYAIERRASMLEKRLTGDIHESYFWDKEEVC
jgi:hypothetical protein